jgi:hypothetical protein
MDAEVTHGYGSIWRKKECANQLLKASERGCEEVTQEGEEQGNNTQG